MTCDPVDPKAVRVEVDAVGEALLAGRAGMHSCACEMYRSSVPGKHLRL